MRLGADSISFRGVYEVIGFVQTHRANTMQHSLQIARILNWTTY